MKCLSVVHMFSYLKIISCWKYRLLSIKKKDEKKWMWFLIESMIFVAHFDQNQFIEIHTKASSQYPIYLEYAHIWSYLLFKSAAFPRSFLFHHSWSEDALLVLSIGFFFTLPRVNNLLPMPMIHALCLTHLSAKMCVEPRFIYSLKKHVIFRERKSRILKFSSKFHSSFPRSAQESTWSSHEMK